MFWYSQLQSFHLAANDMLFGHPCLSSCLFPAAPQRKFPFSSVQNCSHDLPGRLEVEFKSRASGNEMLSPAFSCLLTLSFWGCNYSPAMFWSELNYRWTLGPPFYIFEEKERFLLFLHLCFPSHPAFHPACIFAEAHTSLHDLTKGFQATVLLYGTNSRKPTYVWVTALEIAYEMLLYLG